MNDAVISPTKEHILLGGGQEAMSVTTTAGRAGKFETKFFHLVYEEEVRRDYVLDNTSSKPGTDDDIHPCIPAICRILHGKTIVTH